MRIESTFTDKKLLIVVLFGFLNIKSVKIYAIPFIFSTTLLLYKLDTLLLKQKNLHVLDISFSAFVLRWRPWYYAPQPSPEYSCGKRSGDGLGAMHLGLHLSTHVEKETCYILATHLGLHLTVLSTHAEKETRYIQYGLLFLFQ